MPSFDIVSEVNQVEVRNAVDQANKELSTRFDFKGSDARVVHADQVLTLFADDDFKLKQVTDIVTGKLTRRGVDIRSLKYGNVEKVSGNKVKQEVTIRVGVEQELAKKIVRLMKDSRMKVQASIQGDAVRVSGGSATICRTRLPLSRNRSRTFRCNMAISAIREPLKTSLSGSIALPLPDRITSLPVLLRPFKAADAPRIRELAGDFEVARMTALIPHPYPPDAAGAWIATHERERAAGLAYVYGITRADDRLLVGAIECRAADDAGAALGYWIGHAYWGPRFRDGGGARDRGNGLYGTRPRRGVGDSSRA